LPSCSFAYGSDVFAGAAAAPCDWSIDCFVSLSFSPAASAVVLFDCVTSPSLPGLRTRIDPAVLLGWS
jgi:hypothetical protein